jgi:nitrogen fixation protein FixH
MTSEASITGSGRFWAFFPVMILAPLVGGLLYLVHRASSDPSFAVEDRYYAKAVSWDDKLAERRVNEALGWRVRSGVSAASKKTRDVSVQLVDREGVPVAGARVEVDAFAVARSSSTVHAVLSEIAPGSYLGGLDASRAGLWEFTFHATRGTDRFTTVTRSDLQEIVR